jgi:hypothetical protein
MNFSNIQTFISEREKLFTGIGIALGAIVVLIVIYLIFPKTNKNTEILNNNPEPRTLEQTLKDLTAPAGADATVSKELLDSVTAPKGKRVEVPKEVIESLTAPVK